MRARDRPDPDRAAACALPDGGGSALSLRPSRSQPRSRSFARAGFGRREAEAVLGCADPDAVAALLAEDRP
jgi:hypothetical protein